jgi:hypothetical protein
MFHERLEGESRNGVLRERIHAARTQPISGRNRKFFNQTGPVAVALRVGGKKPAR